MAEDVQTSTGATEEVDLLTAMSGAEESEKANDSKATEPIATKRIKYNGEDMDIPLDDSCIPILQKGMNYDTIKQRYDELGGNDAREAVALEKELAESMGLTPAEYRKQARENLERDAMEAELKTIYDDDPDISPDHAAELAQGRLNAKRAANKERAENKAAAPFEKLLERFPDIKSGEDIPEAVRESINKGEDPVTAMLEFENAKMRSEMDRLRTGNKAAEKNASNQAAAVGAVKTTADGQHDDIWSVLMGGG